MFVKLGSVRFLIVAVLLMAFVGKLHAGNSIANDIPPTIQPLKAQGIANFYKLSDRFYSGSAPEGDAAFACLKKLGIKTIITVDGMKPDADSARRFGIRYVHLPIGYDGVPAKQALRLVKAAETLPGPIYVHCHHGQHRGPAGAAVICMAVEGWTPAEAESWLRLAGTSTNYPGLYRSVERFRPPSAAVLKHVSDDFPEKSPVSPLADVMIEVDGRFDHLKLIKKAGYKTPGNHPDLEPAQEALMLDELFKELLRSSTVENRPAAFKAKLSEAEQAAEALQQSFVGGDSMRSVEPVFQRLDNACTACHKAYRN